MIEANTARPEADRARREPRSTLGQWSADRLGATLDTMHPTGVAGAAWVFASVRSA
jgi:hypothetical protein